MKFLTIGEKVRNTRKQLKLTQFDLEDIGITRSFISMIESNKRSLSYDKALRLSDFFNKKAEELGIALDIDKEYFWRDKQGEAEKYCLHMLKDENENIDLDEIFNVCEEYGLEKTLIEVYIFKGNREFDNKNFELAFNNYFQALEICKKHEVVNRQPFLYNRMGMCRNKLLNHKEALFFYGEAYKNSILYDDKITTRNSLYNLAITNKRFGDYNKSLELIDKCIKVINMEEPLDLYVSAVIVKANCYLSIKQYNKAKQLYEEALKQLNNESEYLLGYIYNNLGELYLKMNESEKSLEYFNKAEDIRLNTELHKLSHVLIEKCSLFIAEEKYLEAIETAERGINLAEENKDFDYVLRGCNVLVELYTKSCEYEKLKQVYFKMIDIFQKANRKEEALKAYIELSIINLKAGDTETALEMLEKSIK